MKIEDSEDKNIHTMLASCMLFHKCNDEALRFIASKLEEIKFYHGDPIFLENEMSDHVYFIGEGQVEIASYQTELRQVNRLAILNRGEHFAEFSVLAHSNKSASAFALTDCVLYRIDGKNFLEILHQFPKIASGLAIVLAKLVRSFTESHSYISYFKTSQIEFNQDILCIFTYSMWKKYKALPLSLKGNVLSMAVMNPHNMAFFNYFKMHHKDLQIDISLIGESDFEHISERLIKRYKSGAGKNAHSLEDASQSSLLTIDMLKKCDLFYHLPLALQKQLIPLFIPKVCLKGELLYSPGEEATGIYIIKSGEIELSKPQENETGFAKIAVFGPEDSIGKVEVLCQSKHELTARALVDCNLIELPKKYFYQLLSRPEFSIPVAKFLARHLQKSNQKAGVIFHDSKKVPSFESTARILPISIANIHKILPLEFKKDALTLGIVNPDSNSIYSIAARYFLGHRINVEIISEEDFKKWIKLYVEASNKENLKNDPLKFDGLDTPNETRRKEKVNATEFIELILLNGIDKRASDIHIEPSGGQLTIRFRVDGVLKEYDQKVELSMGGDEIINRLKIMSDMDITQHMVPQDGQLKANIKGVGIFARVSSVPTKHGQKLVLRLIPEKSNVIPLNMLAPDIRVVNILRNVSKLKQGLFIITGPTGSGKTTTLYSLLNQINRVDINVTTLEDPVELNIPGITQIEINNKQKMTFEKGMRAILRQDPDCIMIGEIRDSETAKIVFEAAITGHLVLSTLHTSGSLDVGPRLMELGVDASTLASGLVGVAAQRLVRKNCDHCAESVPLEKSQIQFIHSFMGVNIVLPEMVKKGDGCTRCNGTGFNGRIPIYEIWRKSPEVQTLLAREGTIVEMEKTVRKDGFDSMTQFGIKMALSGLTTIDEIRRSLSTLFSS